MLFSKGDSYDIAKIHKQYLKVYWANFSQTWHIAFLGEKIQVFQMKGHAVFQGMIITTTKFKNLQNHWVNFNQT